MLVKSFLLPVLRYADLVFSSSLNLTCLNIVRRPVHACVRYDFCLKRRDNITSFHYTPSFSILTISNYISAYSYIYDLLISGKPAYLQREIRFRNLEWLRNITIPRHRTNQLNASLFVRSIAVFNSLPPEIKLMGSREAFRRCSSNHVNKL